MPEGWIWAHSFDRWLQSANSIYFQGISAFSLVMPGISELAATILIIIIRNQRQIYTMTEKSFLFLFSSFSLYSQNE
jgi:hypothetical protein